MKAYTFGTPKREYELNLTNFRGIDLSGNPITMDPSRSPDCKNLMADRAGFPVSRTGVETKLRLEGEIFGLFRAFDGFVIHHGNCLSFWDPETETLMPLMDTMAERKSRGITMAGMLLVLDGRRMVKLERAEEGVRAVYMDTEAYVPTVVIGRDAETGGGTAFEAVNLLGRYRTDSFLGKANVKTYGLSADGLDEDEVTARVLKTDGSWKLLSEGVDFTLDRAEGIVTFTAAPGASPITGYDNVEVTYAKTVPGYMDRINGCTQAALYGVDGSENRLFLTGNEKWPNYDFRSDIYDPSYFPDLGYAVIGEEEAAVCGYLRLQDGTQAILKEKSGGEPTIYYRQGQLVNNEAVFPLTPGAVGPGAAAPYAFGYLGNEPLYLSREGLCAVVMGQDPTGNVKYARNRSYFVDKKLTAEKNLQDAAAVTLGGIYYLAVGDSIYLADGRYTSRVNGTTQYEWYLWDGLGACVMAEDGQRLWFGTKDGRILRMKDGDEIGAYFDDDKPVACYWTTPVLDFGTLTHFKTLKNFYATPSPFSKSEIKVDYVVKSVERNQLVRNVNIFDFSSLDFADLSFDPDHEPRIIPTGRKQRKFMLMRVKLSSDSGQAFGFYAMTFRYLRLGNYRG